MAGDRRPVEEVDDIAILFAEENEMAITAGEQHLAMLDLVPGRGLFHRQSGEPIEPVSEGGGEELGHVLDDDHTGQISG